MTTIHPLRAAAALALALAAGAAAAQARYTITDLGASVTPTAINASGTVAGYTASGQAFTWKSGTLTPLADLGHGAAAYAIADDGTVGGAIGVSRLTPQVPTVWSPDGTPTVLPSFARQAGVVYGVDASGRAVGEVGVDAQGSHAFLAQGGTMVDLDPGFTGGRTTAVGIDAQGDVVGRQERLLSQGVGQIRSGLHRHDGRFVELDRPGATYYDARAINRAGHVIGEAYTDAGEYHATLWTPSASIDVGRAGENELALALNGRDEVVGCFYSATQQGIFIAADGTFTPLAPVIADAQGWIFTCVDGINDAGQIIGYGSYGDVSHGFVLTPIAQR